jgi:AbrB family looped-hinge helix DNA binding protein
VSATVTSKGQVTIPKAVRDLLDLQPGTGVEFRLANDGTIVLERADKKPTQSFFAKFRGREPNGMTTDELMALTRGED